MAIKNPDGTFSCLICKRGYESVVSADACRDSHEMIYFPISRDELNQLAIFIHTGNASGISVELLDRLDEYKRNSVRNLDKFN
jgi:hypothetical protein